METLCRPTTGISTISRNFLPPTVSSIVKNLVQFTRVLVKRPGLNPTPSNPDTYTQSAVRYSGGSSFYGWPVTKGTVRVETQGDRICTIALTLNLILTSGLELTEDRFAKIEKGPLVCVN